MDLTHNNATSLNVRYRHTLATGSLDVRFYWQNTFHEMNFLSDKDSSGRRGFIHADEHPWPRPWLSGAL